MVARSVQWSHEHHRGDAASFHDRDPAAGAAVVRSAWWFDVDAPTLVLGSSQRLDDVDTSAAAASGISVVRRHSGGGSVLLWPGEFVWLDVIVPAGDVLWHDDVGRAMHWIGEVWREALATVGVEADVHRGRFEPRTWGRQVCFAGVGPGEVVAAGGRKVVGVSQRRTRDWARLQTVCHLGLRPDTIAALVAPPRPSVAELRELMDAVDVDHDDLVAALSFALDRR